MYSGEEAEVIYSALNPAWDWSQGVTAFGHLFTDCAPRSRRSRKEGDEEADKQGGDKTTGDPVLSRKKVL